MRLSRAHLVKRSTDDGLFEVKDEIVLGKVYFVDLRSIRTVALYNLPKRQFHAKEVITILEHGEPAGFIATELLRIEGE